MNFSNRKKIQRAQSTAWRFRLVSHLRQSIPDEKSSGFVTLEFPSILLSGTVAGSILAFWVTDASPWWNLTHQKNPDRLFSPTSLNVFKKDRPTEKRILRSRIFKHAV